MSKLCKKISCPNRISYGRIDDLDVINVVCPKCEDLLYVSDIRKSEVKKKKKYLVYILFITIIAFLFLKNYDTFVEQVDNPESDFQEVEKAVLIAEEKEKGFVKEDEKIKEIDWSNKIRNLVAAEAERNLYKIKEFYADNIVQYYDMYAIDKVVLGERYKQVWEKSLESSNDIQRISKIDENTYIMRTIFKDQNKRSKKRISVDVKVKFVFDEQGKIIQSYNVR